MIKIFDTTLRDGEQSPGCSMNLSEKIRIAKQLEKLGVDVIEAGFAASSKGDYESVNQIAKTIEKPVVLSLARCHKGDIDKAIEAVKPAKNPEIHVFIATSDIHMKYKLQMSREEVYKRAVESVKYAKEHIDYIEFSCEDYSRSDPKFVYEILEGVIEAGACVLNLPDTVGYSTPEEYYKLIKGVKENVKGIDRVDISVHCHDDLGLAVANSLSAILAGATQIEGAINGIGERAGNTALEEVIMALDTRKDIYEVSTNINTKEIYPTCKLLASIIGQSIPPNKAIVGANAFAHESGIHQHGVLKEKSTYEIMKPESIGIYDSETVVLGKHSGKHAFTSRLMEMGYDFSEEEIENLFEKFKDLADKKKTVYNEDILALMNEDIATEEKEYELVEFITTTSKSGGSETKITLNHKGKIKESKARGDGPISAAFECLRNMAGDNIVLEDFKIRSITRGKDALGETTVLINVDNKKYSGKGLSTDIIEASILAYINAVNNIGYFEERRGNL